MSEAKGSSAGSRSERAAKHRWQFAARFRRNAFGWRSQPAVTRVKEAVAEIKAVVQADPVLAAEGAVLFLEKVSPALEQVDSSSGSIGTAVNHAIEVLAGVIREAPAEPATRERWLERLFQAHADDEIPYIESLAEHWGELCGSPELASAWADRLLETTRAALAPDRKPGTFFHGTTACLAALYAAGRHDELVALLTPVPFWPYRRWAVKALAARGDRAEAIRLAESSRGPWTPDRDVDCLCEEILLSSGLVDEAYRRYGLRANRKGTYLAWFRAVAKRYPQRARAEVLADLVASTPGEEGKWFAAAKDAGLRAEAVELAGRSPCSPQTLTRAARDFADRDPEFALGAGMAALRWLVAGHGWEVTSADVADAFEYTMRAAERAGCVEETLTRIGAFVAKDITGQGFATRILVRRLEQTR